jgi:putative lipoic acid-binding regulatory protein
MLEDGNVIGEIKKDFTLTVTGKTTETFKDAVSRTFEKTIEDTYKDNVTEDATGKDYNIKAKTVKIEGAVEIILMTVGSAAWVPNCIPTCPFGVPHGGQPGGIMGLKGA